MKVVGHIRVSSDKQDLEKQQHLLWQYTQTHQLLIHESVRVEISSQKKVCASDALRNFWRC